MCYAVVSRGCALVFCGMKHLMYLTALVLLACVACKKEGRPEGSLRPALGGKYQGGTFRVNETGELSSLDPVRINDVTSAHIAQNIYDNLLQFDEHLRLQPDLAHSWEVSADGLEYTYHLRNDVWFHDNACFPDGKGRKFTAHDAKYSLTRNCDARTKTKSYDYFRGKVQGADAYYEATRKANAENPSKVSGVSGFVVDNDTTFRIRLTAPFAPFENYVGLTAMAIHAREAVEKYGEDFGQNPVGTGAFAFVRWQPDRDLTLKRNERYWKFDEVGNRLPLLDGVRFSFLKDDKLQLLEFAAGNLEESYKIANEFFGDIVDENKKPKGTWAKYKLLHVPAVATQYYGFLNTSEAFKDKRVRQAFNYAVDRNRIIKYVLRGQAFGPAEHGLVPPAMPDYPTSTVKGYAFDPLRAKQLMTDAGYPNGKGFPPVTLQLNSGGGRNTSVAEAVQNMLMEHLNVRVDLVQVEFAQHLDAIDNGKAPFFRLGWVGDYPDPESFLNLYNGKLVPTDGSMSPINSVRYVNPAYDAMLQRALAETDHAKRMILYRDAEQIAIADAPMLLLFHDEDFRFVQPYVRDYRNNSMDQRPYRYIWFDASLLPAPVKQ